MNITKKKQPCVYHKRRWGEHTVRVEGGGFVETCDSCLDKILNKKRYVCKHCGIPIAGKYDYTPLSVKYHAFGCPRREGAP